MEYIKGTITTCSAGCDLLTAQLGEVCMGLEIDDPTVIADFVENKESRWDYIEEGVLDNPERPVTARFYIIRDEDGLMRFDQVKAELDRLRALQMPELYGPLTLETEIVSSQDWENNWKQFYHPFNVGSRLLVRPSWEECENPEGRVELVMDPASSFGTGSHATTRMCMDQLESMELQDKHVLDMGCGSGILACTALLLGAGDALCCDIEPSAMTCTAENMQKNGVTSDRWQTLLGDVLTEEPVDRAVAAGAPYDLILANIVADVLKAMRDKIFRNLADNGRVILSGIIDVRGDEVENWFREGGFATELRREQAGWVMLCMKKA